MPALEFPKSHIRFLQDLGTRLLDGRKQGTPSEAFARELLGGFYDVCMQAGLDRVLTELEMTYPPLDLTHRAGLSDHPKLHAQVVHQLEAINLDGGGPRGAKPKQIADSLIAGLGLTLIDEPDRTITLDHTTRTEVASAMAGVIEIGLGVPKLRETIVANARKRCDEKFIISFDKMAAQLDDHGMRMVKQPKIPVDAVQAIQQYLFDARNAVFGAMGNTAIDRARDKLAQTNAEAAARIDAPISLKLTPRDVAIIRMCDARVPKATAAVVESLLGSLTELSHLAWRAPERPVRPYAASQTFAVGELVEHPKFGRGTVLSTMAARVEIEFPEGKYTLVHVPPRK